MDPSLSHDEPIRLQALRNLKQVHTPLEERFERITRLAKRLLRTSISAISLVESDFQWFKSIQGLNVSETSRAVSFCGHTILGNESMVIPDARIDPRFAENPLVTGSPNIVFYAGHPIRSQEGSNIATLCVIDHAPRELDSEELQVLQDLAALAEVELNMSMHSAAQHELMTELDTVSRRAKVDELTRIWNRSAICELLEIAHSRALQRSRGFGLLIADIDHFKTINDTYGHCAGDEILRQCAKRMLGAVRDIDDIGRYGGEEFMIVLGRCENADVGAGIAERIRTSISEQPFETDFGTIKATISIGFAYADPGQNVSQECHVRSADRALYKAKDAGRNRIETCAPRETDYPWSEAA